MKQMYYNIASINTKLYGQNCKDNKTNLINMDLQK